MGDQRCIRNKDSVSQRAFQTAEDVISWSRRCATRGRRSATWGRRSATRVCRDSARSVWRPVERGRCDTVALDTRSTPGDIRIKMKTGACAKGRDASG